MFLQGKTALVTGATGGLGVAQTEALAREGAAVLMLDVKGEEEAVAIRERLPAGAGAVRYVGCDLADSQAAQDLARKLDAEAGAGCGSCGRRAGQDQLLDMLGIDLDLLDAGAQGLGERGVGGTDRRLEAFPDRAKVAHDFHVPRRRGGKRTVEMLPRRRAAPALGQPEAEHQHVHVQAAALLKQSETGSTGYKLAHSIFHSHGIDLELYSENVVVAIFGLGEPAARAGERLVAALREAVPELEAEPGTPQEKLAPPPPWGELVLSPREAFLGPQEVIPFDAAAGRIAAEGLAAYPPGIPNVLPGERLTAETLDYIRESVAVTHEVQTEDVGVCEEVQRNLNGRSYQAGRFSVKRENGGYYFHQMLARRLQSFSQASGGR